MGVLSGHLQDGLPVGFVTYGEGHWVEQFAAATTQLPSGHLYGFAEGHDVELLQPLAV